MGKIIEYKIIANFDYTVVIDKVNELIKQGYQPYGPMVATAADSGDGQDEDLVYQPMVKYEKGKE